MPNFLFTVANAHKPVILLLSFYHYLLLVYEVNHNEVEDVQGTYYDKVAMGQRFLREYNYMANILFVTLLSVTGRTAYCIENLLRTI